MSAGPGKHAPDDEKPEEGTNWAARDTEVRARIRELELQRKTGDLVPVAEVKAKLAQVFSEVRTRLLGLSVRAKARIPRLTDADAAVLDGLIREALTALAEGR